MGLSTQERTFSLCYPKSFMDISRAFCFGGTMQVRVPSTENQTAHVLGLLEAMPPHLGAGVLAGCPAELVHSSEGLSDWCLASYDPPTLVFFSPGHDPYTQRTERAGTTLGYVSSLGSSKHP